MKLPPWLGMLASKYGPRGIGWRIFISFTVLMVALTSLFSFLGLQFAQSNITENASNELRLLSVVLSRQVQRQLSRIEDSLTDLETSDFLHAEVRKSQPDEQALEAFLIERLAALPLFSDLAIYSKAGLCLGSTRTELYDLPVQQRPFFVQGLKGFNISEISLSDEGRLQLVSLPIIIGKTVRGVLVGQVNLTSIYDLMDQRLGLAQTTEAFLVDRRLRFITPSEANQTYEGQHLQSSHLVETPLVRHLRDEFWVGKYQGLSGREVLGTALRIPGAGWYVVVERDLSEILRPVSTVKSIVVIAALVITLALILVTLLLTRSITRPLSLLVRSTQRLAQGDLNHPIDIPRGIGEVAFLAREIEGMRAKIAAFQERMWERLEESEKRRIDSERLAAIGTLASTLAHEIRNPLNAMSLLLSRLELNRSQIAQIPEAALSVTQGLRGEIARLDRLVSDILDYARPLQLQWRDVNLQMLIEGTVGMYRDYCEERGVDCRLRLPSEPIHLRADPDRLKQCLVNLLQNAIDAVVPGGHIDIAATATGNAVEILLCDDGVGLPQEAEGRLFDLFFTTKEKGTGLGLSTVKKIVDAHGGAVAITRRAGAVVDSGHQVLAKGTVVRLQLPIEGHS